MSGDQGASQETIKALADDQGLKFIRDLADRHILKAQRDQSGLRLWVDEICPLFQLITHERVVDSAVLEQQVAMIYNLLNGVHGERMVRVFNFILTLVQSWPASTTSVSKMAVIELSLAVLTKMMDCNTLLMIDERLSSIIRGFERCINSEPESAEDFSCVQAKRYLDYIRQRLEVGQEIDVMEPNVVPVIREAFVLRRDLPGTLSAEGPRHDNDNKSISKIKILPTSEEIMSPRREYLPTTDSSQWHVPGIRGRVDREFRLLREDTVGQLRDAVHDTLDRIRNVDVRVDRSSKNTVRTFSYELPTPVDIGFDSFSGLQFTIQCNQPPALKGMTAKRRREWWMQSKRLQSGALVCVLDATGSVQFFVVSESTMRTEDDDVAKKKAQRGQNSDSESVPKELLTLSGSEEHLFVTLQLVDAGASELRRTLRWYRSTRSSPRRYIVEFPGVLLASFQHTLTALKRISEQPRIPFHDLIAPSSEVNQQTVIASPLYTRKAGFEFDLRLLTNDNTSLKVDPRHPPEPEALASRSSLDLTQSRALLCALTQELCLIQGPPGTGKSYTGEKIIKVLLEHKKQINMGPILCVCYTNHALDQLLEHLLDEGVDRVIRIGSRSKSERLQNRNLRLVAKTAERTRTEGRELYIVQDEIRDIDRDLTKLIGDLADLESVETIKTHLRATSPRHFHQLFVIDENEWTEVTYKEKPSLAKWLQSGSHDRKQSRQLVELQLVNLFDMSHLERRKIYNHWIETLRDPIIEKMTDLYRKYTTASEQRDRIRGDTDLRCLQQADVVGVTTTGLARQLETLRKLRSKVMVCEEAGEVLEAHILTALLPSLESAILIGDHLQLRPQIQNYELQSTNPRGQQYSLDMSLFERLVQPLHDGDVQVPFSTLETQRRMHPFMSELIRSTLYPALMDSESVQKYPKVVGMKQRLFWLHHEHLEASAANNDPLNTSRSNDFEIEMTTALVSHLTRQGEYAQGEIAVITPYLGQLHKLRRRMESMFEICVNDRDLEDLEMLEEEDFGNPTPKKPTATRKTTLLKSVRVATVDNFQGEEAKIIVISLVRSNPQNVCGFLSTSNRINVLLSRAKHGMYIIGNSNTCQRVPMWAQVMNILQDKGQFGTSLELECPRHPNTPILVSEADHFVQFSPESGCQLPCEKRLDCGHSCTGKCHSNVIHSAVKCLEPCPRLKKGCDHVCPLRCGDPCQKKCQVRLKDLRLVLDCGHIVTTAECWQAQDPSLIRCSVTVTRNVPGCEHKVQVPTIIAWWFVARTSLADTRAKVLVSSVILVRAARSRKRITASVNNHVDEATLLASTTVPKLVIQALLVLHAISPVKCGAAIQNAPKLATSLACHVPRRSASRAALTLSVACPAQLLVIGYPARSAKCASDQVRQFCVDFVELKLYEDINLDEEPCIFPDCGHFLTISSMDGIMQMSDHYELDMEEYPIKLRGPSAPFTMEEKSISVCATCRGSLRSISRYGRIVRRSILDETTKRFITWSSSQHEKLAKSMLIEFEKLESTPTSTKISAVGDSMKVLTPQGSRLSILQALETALGNDRYKKIIKLRQKLNVYKNKVARDEQPFHRVATYVQSANRRNKETREFQYDDSVIQNKGMLLAESLLLKTEITAIADFIGLCKSGKARPPKIQVDFASYFKACDQLIGLATSFKYPKEQLQGHIFYAWICEFARWFSANGDKKDLEVGYKEKGMDHIRLARDILESHPSTAPLLQEVESAEFALKGHEYRQVTTDELREVYIALSGDLRGTGHWYTCENGHPFTIGECGMPMEQARCPECNAPIGGQNHQAVDGVRRAEEIERLTRGVGNL
ncbi:unnamed protein product [Clonostachys byssicola]|uniref:RZ-type domain-containing protein n=1 Tax=Clonostachys byssicola TaxID=160290 RepID=A0A9N9U759_9HYPO|nr:unnamed protein product [Clonostachys byssicola]